MGKRTVTQQEVFEFVQGCGRFVRGREVAAALDAEGRSVTTALRGLAQRGALTQHLHGMYYWYGVGMSPDAALFHRVMMGIKPVRRDVS